MKILKITGIIIGVLLALGVLLYFIAPKSSYFERKIVIDAPREQVYRVVDNMADFNEWSPWFAMDTASVITMEGPESGPGARMAWESEVLGDGAMWIDSDSPTDEVVYKMSFAGYNSEPVARLLLVETAEGTAVTWTYEDEDTQGLFRIGNLFNMTEMMLRDPYEDGLQNLKEYVESLPKEEQQIAVMDFPGMQYAGIETTISSANSEMISATMGESYGKILQFLQENGKEMNGMPFTIYPSFDENTLTMICAIPVSISGLESTDDIILGEIPASVAVKAIHTGPYDQLQLTHTAVNEYIMANGLEMAAPPFEQYITDPGQEPDPSKWITWVFYPVNR